MHYSWEENYQRGYEWWLMTEAKKVKDRELTSSYVISSPESLGSQGELIGWP